MSFEMFDTVRSDSNNNLFELVHKNNGLKVVLCPRPNTPEVVTANILFHVGSCNETSGNTGATHFLEHLAFKGSLNFNGDNDIMSMMKHGCRINATTSNDRTNFYMVLNTGDLPEWLEKEADRIQNLNLNDVDRKSELTVVRNEFERGENQPVEILYKKLYATALSEHPYRHTTIGYRTDIEEVSIDKIRAFHDQFYIPNNCTLTLVGNFDVGETLKHIDAFLGQVPKGTKPPNVYTLETKQEGQKFVEIERNEQTTMVGLGFKTVPGTHKDSAALTVLADMLHNGHNGGRLDSLVKQNTIVGGFVENSRLRFPSLFVTSVSVPCTFENGREKARVAQDALLGIIADIKNSKPEQLEKEMQFVKKNIVQNYKDSMESTYDFTMLLNEAISLGDAFDTIHFPSYVDKVTPHDIVRVANDYLNPTTLTVAHLVPCSNPSQDKTFGLVSPEVGGACKKNTFDLGNILQGSCKNIDATSAAPNLGYWKVGGLHDLCILNHSYYVKNRFVLSFMNGGSYSAYLTNKNRQLSNMLSDMLSDGVLLDGKKLDNKDMSMYMIENNFKLNVTSNKTCMTMNVECGPEMESLQAALEFAKAILFNATLDKNNFESKRQNSLSIVNSYKRSLSVVNASEMANVFYPAHSINFTQKPADMYKDLTNMTHNDLVSFYKNNLKDSMVKCTFVGKKNEELKLLTKFLTCFKNNKCADATEMKDELSVTGCKNLNVPIENKTSKRLDMRIPTSIKPCDDRFLHLKVASSILGNGFLGRLMKVVREEHGLTYGIYASATPGLKNTNAFMDVQATFAPELLDKGVKYTNIVLDEFFKNGVTQKELEDNVGYFIGARNISQDNPEHTMSLIHNQLLENRDLEELVTFNKRVKGITLDALNTTIKNIGYGTTVASVISG